MKVIDWINKDIIANGLLCEEYVERVRKAKSKKQLFEIVCDANGVNFIPEMRSRGARLSYEDMENEFGRYLNGKYKPHFEGTNPTSDGYTSAIYVGLSREKGESIVIDTTLACIMGCCCDVYIPPMKISRIVLDEGCKVRIHCPKSSKIVVEHYWSDLWMLSHNNIEIVEGGDCVRVRNMLKER